MFKSYLLCISLHVYLYISTCELLQTQDAMAIILRDLHEDDHFGIVLFDDDITTWRDSLTKATKTNVSKAIDYVRKANADSGMRNFYMESFSFHSQKCSLIKCITHFSQWFFMH